MVYMSLVVDLIGLLDDHLSAVDAKVGEHIFEQCICRLLKEKIVILATYAERNMKAADQVVILHKGSVQGKGSFYELQNEGKFLDAVIDPSATASQEQTRISRKIEKKVNQHNRIMGHLMTALLRIWYKCDLQ